MLSNHCIQQWSKL